MDEAITTEFYVTLPSDSSTHYFPANTQSSFRTKLSAPLILNGDWEVGLSEIFIPKSWYNIDEHNNGYTVSFETEQKVLVDILEYEVKYLYERQESAEDFCVNINNQIDKSLGVEHGIKFLNDEEGNVLLEIAEGFEIYISKQGAPKLLYMLHLPPKDIILNETGTYKFRPTTREAATQIFKVINKNLKRINEFIIPTMPIKQTAYSQTGKGLSDVLNENIRLLDLEDVVKFTYTPDKREMLVNISAQAEIRITASTSPTLMQKFNIEKDTTLTGMQTLKVNPLSAILPGETILLRIKERYEKIEIMKKTEHLTLNVGMYKSAESLFASFQHIRLSLLPNLKVLMVVLPNYEAQLSKGLSDMLGFTNTAFTEGSHIGKYPLQLDAGITEIFVYSDIISSHHVGDSFAPLLRVIPCAAEGESKIIKNYYKPLYFPLKKTFLETIEIELRTGFGSKITFTGGKTHIVLSFRRRKL